MAGVAPHFTVDNLMASINILYTRKGNQRLPVRIFNDETEIAEFEAAIKEAQETGCEIITDWVAGEAIPALREYLNKGK